MKPKLISFRLCPFVRRAVMMLGLKSVDFDIAYVDLAEPPEWFLKLSPRKKVPLLQVGEEILFESVAIMEYLDEAYNPPLHPTDLVEKARHRAWMEFSNQCLWRTRDLTTLDTQEAFHRVVDDLCSDFEQLEPLVVSPYFAGESIHLVDVSFAPVFQQIDQVESLTGPLYDHALFPRLKQWRESLGKHPVLRASLGEDFEERYYQLIARRGGYLAGLLPKGYTSENRSEY